MAGCKTAPRFALNPRRKPIPSDPNLAQGFLGVFGYSRRAIELEEYVREVNGSTIAVAPAPLAGGSATFERTAS